jgi:hypothetical protein
VLIPAEVTPTSVLGKARAVAENDIPKAVPVPESVTTCGEPAALSAILSAAKYEPTDGGVNVTEIVQLLLEATVVQVFCEIAKALAFVPERVTPLMVRLALPLLVTVIGMAEEVVVAGVPVNVTAVVESVTAADVLGVALELDPQPASSPRAAIEIRNPRIR